MSDSYIHLLTSLEFAMVLPKIFQQILRCWPTTICHVKVKVTRNRPEGPEGGRGIALLFLDLGARRGWVVSTTPRPLYARERPGTHCTGGWVGPRAGLPFVSIRSKIHKSSSLTARLNNYVADLSATYDETGNRVYKNTQISCVFSVLRATNCKSCRVNHRIYIVVKSNHLSALIPEKDRRSMKMKHQ
jgi:hypothetical protein